MKTVFKKEYTCVLITDEHDYVPVPANLYVGENLMEILLVKDLLVKEMYLYDQQDLKVYRKFNPTQLFPKVTHINWSSVDALLL